MHRPPLPNIDSFARSLIPSEEDYQNADNVANFAVALVKSTGIARKCLIFGSVKSRTALRRIRDVDVLVELHEWNDNKPVMNRLYLRNALVSKFKRSFENAGASSEYSFCVHNEVEFTLRRQRSSIGLCLGPGLDPEHEWMESITVDLVPMKHLCGSTWKIAKTYRNPMQTKPFSLLRRTNTIDLAWNGEYRLYVLLVKKWNEINMGFWGGRRLTKPFQSYHLEVICWHWAIQRDVKPSNIAAGFKSLLKWISRSANHRVLRPGFSTKYLNLRWTRRLDIQGNVHQVIGRLSNNTQEAEWESILYVESPNMLERRTEESTYMGRKRRRLL
jgi:predicted nucleotidyltransferase